MFLETLGFKTFLSPEGIERVYYEFHVSISNSAISENLSRNEIIVEALQAEGLMVSKPRYPLLHNQPFFTQSYWRDVARIGPSQGHLEQNCDAKFPVSTKILTDLIRLPVFHTECPELIEQYKLSFEKVMSNLDAILESAERTRKQ
jgi:dTDP-4-amino-4,6-dideoxygalactose transaminase